MSSVSYRIELADEEGEREAEVGHAFVGAILRNVMCNFNVKLLEN